MSLHNVHKMHNAISANCDSTSLPHATYTRSLPPENDCVHMHNACLVFGNMTHNDRDHLYRLAACRRASNSNRPHPPNHPLLTQIQLPPTSLNSQLPQGKPLGNAHNNKPSNSLQLTIPNRPRPKNSKREAPPRSIPPSLCLSVSLSLRPSVSPSLLSRTPSPYPQP